MRVLFLDGTGSGQFDELAAAVATRPGVEVVHGAPADRTIDGVRSVAFVPHRRPDGGSHPYVKATERHVLVGQAAFRAIVALDEQGFVPDVVATSCDGPGLFVPECCPRARRVAHLRWPTVPHGRIDEACAGEVSNASAWLTLAESHLAITTTCAARRSVPDAFRPWFEVLAEPVDTGWWSPADAPPEQQRPVVTVETAPGAAGAAGLVEAARSLAAARPDVDVVVLTDPDLGPLGLCDANIGEAVADPLKRLELLRRSSAHLDLGAPGPVSAALVQALATGVAVVTSRTDAASEIAGGCAELVDTSDPSAIIGAVTGLIEDPARAQVLGARARATALEHHDRDVVARRWLTLVGGGSD